MIVPCKISSAEMREAFRLNLTSSFWWKAALGNRRAIVYGVVVIVVIVTRLKGSRAIDWAELGVLIGLVALFFGLYLLRLHRSIEKTAKKLNESCSNLTIDGQGLTVELTNGSRTFIPWSAITRWREGKLVFTIGEAKSFRTVSKSTLGEMQSGELRSLLLSQIQTSSLGR
jgi:hypothetical protein